MGTEKNVPKVNAESGTQAQQIQTSVSNEAASSLLNRTTTPAERLAAALAKHREIIHQSTADRLRAAKRSQLYRPDELAEIRKGNKQVAGGWFFGPGELHLLALADERLTLLARGMGVRTVKSKVAKVHVEFAEDDLMVIYPAEPTDMNAFEVHRYESNVVVNLSNRMIAAGVSVETGWKELRPIVFVPQDSELWPGLAVDFSLPPMDRKVAVSEKEEGPEAEDDSDTDEE